MNTNERHRKSVLVAILDSGVNTEVYDLKEYVKENIGYRVNMDGYITKEMNLPVQNEHGTAIALVIKSICNEIEFLSVNILNERLVTDGRILIYALKQTLEYNPDIIHLSLGTQKWKYLLPLYRIVNEAKRRKILIVSAANNNDQTSYPAYFRNVIGVKRPYMNNNRKIYYDKKFFYAPDSLGNTPGASGLSDRGIRGSSISAAYVTGLVSNIIVSNNINQKREIIERLRSM